MSDICDLIVTLKLINFGFQVFIVLVPEMSTNFMSYFVEIIYIALVTIL